MNKMITFCQTGISKDVAYVLETFYLGRKQEWNSYTLRIDLKPPQWHPQWLGYSMAYPNPFSQLS